MLDGGTGRELLRIGAPFRQPEWSALALWEAPERVVEAHANFLDAGADVITTNSYALVPFHIGDDRFRDDGRMLADLAGRLARAAVDDASQGRSTRVAGSLPPLFGSYRPDLFEADVAPSLIDPLVAGLVAHVDLWLGETLGSIAEARAVRDALDRAALDTAPGATPHPLWLSFTLDADDPTRLRSGEAVTDAADAALDLGASALAFNCCPVDAVTVALRLVTDRHGDRLEIGGYANRFVSDRTSPGAANAGLSSLRDDLDPEAYLSAVEEWLDAGATIVGGCCGIEPEHIRRIAAHVGGTTWSDTGSGQPPI